MELNVPLVFNVSMEVKVPLEVKTRMEAMAHLEVNVGTQVVDNSASDMSSRVGKPEQDYLLANLRPWARKTLEGLKQCNYPLD